MRLAPHEAARSGLKAIMLDIFAWIVLIVLIASTVAVVVFLAMLPGMIARRRSHPWAQAVTVAGWVTLFLGFVLWPVVLIWAYVDVPAPRGARAGAMIVVLLNVYLVILFVLVKLRIVPFNLFWKVSPVIVLLLLLVGLFIPMGWGAPQGPVLVVRNSVADRAGRGRARSSKCRCSRTQPLKAGDVLFRIDPVPYQSQVGALQAQLKLQELRLGQMTQLQVTGTGRAFDVEQRQAEVDQLKAQVDGAQWNLDKTVVRAPADGYVTNRCAAQGRTRRQPAAAAGDGVHRHVRDHHRRGDPADRCPLYRGRGRRSS